MSTPSPEDLMGLTEEDSEDLTDEEVERAVVVTSSNEVTQAATVPIVAFSERFAGQKIKIAHELRRRSPHLYHRLRLSSSEGAEEVLVFRADWLQQHGEPVDGD